MNGAPSFELILDAKSRNGAIEKLASHLNSELKSSFEKVKAKDRKFLAAYLIEKVESLVEELNEHSYDLGRIDYGGDINYEESEQSFSNKLNGPDRIILEFKGFSCDVSWEY